MGFWRSGILAKWEIGEVGNWRSGKLAKWEIGGVRCALPLPQTIQTTDYRLQTSYTDTDTADIRYSSVCRKKKHFVQYCTYSTRKNRLFHRFFVAFRMTNYEKYSTADSENLKLFGFEFEFFEFNCRLRLSRCGMFSSSTSLRLLNSRHTIVSNLHDLHISCST